MSMPHTGHAHVLVATQTGNPPGSRRHADSAPS